MSLKEQLNKTVEYCDSIFKETEKKFDLSFRKALIINLETEKADIFQIPDYWIEEYVSGPALGARLWTKFYSDDNDSPIIITSPITEEGTCTSIVFKSPETSNLTVNYASAYFGRTLRQFGYNAVIIKGKYKSLGSVRIEFDHCSFSSCEYLKGKTASECVRTLKLHNTDSFITTGPSADYMIKFSTCLCDSSLSGRGGLGFAFSNKNLKAVVISGSDEKLKVENEEEAPYINVANYRGWAPVKNFTRRTDPRIFHLSNSEFKRLYTDKGISEKLPPFDAVLMLGSNTGCFDMSVVLSRYSVCYEMVMDPVSVGNILGSCINDFESEDQVLSFIHSLSRDYYSKPILKTGKMACGPYDYRGNFTQALSDCCGNWFPVIFNSNHRLCLYNQDFWAMLSENIVMGIESFGLSSTTMIAKIRKPNRILSQILNFSPFFAKKYFVTDDVARLLSVQLETLIVHNDIIELGARCKRLFYDINSIINPNGIQIPDFFCLEPESNYRKLEIVPIFDLKENYYKRLMIQFASQKKNSIEKKAI